jgi:hypothetical protein
MRFSAMGNVSHKSEQRGEFLGKGFDMRRTEVALLSSKAARVCGHPQVTSSNSAGAHRSG